MGGPGTLQETWGKCKDSDWGVRGLMSGDADSIDSALSVHEQSGVLGGGLDS